MITLIKPTPDLLSELADYKQEFIEDGSELHGCSDLNRSEDLLEWIHRMALNTSPDTVQDGYVPASTYCLVDTKTLSLIGIVNIRHTLNDHLLAVGGHIGYSIRPKMRKKGYGTLILRLALEKCTELGVEPVLITADAHNTASRKVIEACGGRLENTMQYHGKLLFRYWIHQA